jgi:hypothetical protein
MRRATFCRRRLGRPHPAVRRRLPARLAQPPLGPDRPADVAASADEAGGLVRIRRPSGRDPRLVGPEHRRSAKLVAAKSKLVSTVSMGGDVAIGILKTTVVHNNIP